LKTRKEGENMEIEIFTQISIWESGYRLDVDFTDC